MHLVGDLSSVRLRDELIALLSEENVEWTLERLCELGVAHEVHPKLATGADTVDLVKRLDALGRRAGPGGGGRDLAAASGGDDAQHVARRALPLAGATQAEALRQRGRPGRGGGGAARLVTSLARRGHDRLGSVPGPARHPDEALVFGSGGHGAGLAEQTACGAT